MISSFSRDIFSLFFFCFILIFLLAQPFSICARGRSRRYIYPSRFSLDRADCRRNARLRLEPYSGSVCFLGSSNVTHTYSCYHFDSRGAVPRLKLFDFLAYSACIFNRVRQSSVFGEGNLFLFFAFLGLHRTK